MATPLRVVNRTAQSGKSQEHIDQALVLRRTPASPPICCLRFPRGKIIGAVREALDIARILLGPGRDAAHVLEGSGPIGIQVLGYGDSRGTSTLAA